jgi:serine/threonine-protein kinase
MTTDGNDGDDGGASVSTDAQTVVVESGKHPAVPASAGGGLSPAEPTSNLRGGAAASGPIPLSEAPNDEDEFPQRLGRYTLLSRLGVGGMAEVLRAVQDGPAGFQKPVVIKRMLPHLAQDERFVEMFLREARIAAGLNHTNIVQIYELGQEGRHYFIAMEYVDGLSLHALARRAWRERRALPMELLLAAVADSAAGLHYAYTTAGPEGEPLGLVHRDVSPDNLIINREGVTKILDFGIAKGTKSRNVTNTGDIKGKIPYMSPEQLHGLEIDHRADLYALGITFYWLLTGERPFKGDSDLLVMQSIIADAPKPPSAINSTVPPAIESIVMSLLNKDRDKRPHSGAVLANDLHQYLSAERSLTARFVKKIIELPLHDRGPSDRTTDGFVPASPTTGSKLDTESKSLAKQAVEKSSAQSAPAAGAPDAGVDVDVDYLSELVSSAEVPAPDLDDVEPGPPVGRSSLPWAVAAGSVGALLLVGGLALFRSDPGPDPSGGETPVASTAPTEPTGPASSAPPIEAPPTQKVPTPPPESAEPTAKPRVAKKVAKPMTVEVKAPASVTWLTPKGDVLGKGAGTLNVPAGVKKIVAHNQATTGKTTIPVGGKPISYARLPMGQIAVLAFPYANVSIGSKKLGMTPLPKRSLTAGTYVVTLEHEGEKRTKRVVVSPGKVATLKERFK